MSIASIIQQISSQTSTNDFVKLLQNISKNREALSTISNAVWTYNSHLLPELIKWYDPVRAIKDMRLHRPSVWDDRLEPLLEVWTPLQLFQNLLEHDNIDISAVNKLVGKGIDIKQVVFPEWSYVNSGIAGLLLGLGYDELIVFKLLLQNNNVAYSKDEADKTVALISNIMETTSEDKVRLRDKALNSKPSCYPSQEYVGFLLSLGIPASNLLTQLIKNTSYVSKEDLANLSNIITTLIQNGGNISEAANELNPYEINHINIDMATILLDNGLSPDKFLFALLYHDHIFGSLDSQVGYTQSLVQLALAKGANVNHKPQGTEETVLDRLIVNTHPVNWQFIDKVVALSDKKGVSLNTYLASLSDSIGYLEDAVGIIARFGDLFNEDEISNHARAAGVSLLGISFFHDFTKLCREYIKYKNALPNVLNELDIAILDPNVPTLPLENYKGKLTNPTGFSAPQLAIIAGKYYLLPKMLEAGFDFNETNPNGINILILLSCIDEQNSEVKEILAKILEHAETIDFINGRGENVVDSFLSNSELVEQIMEKSNDPIYACFKKDNLNPCLLTNTDKTYIGISHGESFWSSGVESVARLISKDFPEIEFRVVTMDIINSNGEKLINQFSGWINPGGGDSYPHGMKEFSQSDWQQSLDTEQLYQYMLNTAKSMGIPTLGMCAGAQNLVLNNNGYLYLLKGYCGEKQHYIQYMEGTIAHFQAMTKAQQITALKTCEFPPITFAGDTAHNFAAVRGKLGDNIVLGAISEENVPMSYCTSNGLHCATQFHPEHHYQQTDTPENVNHEKAWLLNFVHLAKMYHDYNKGNGFHPQDYLQHVQDNISLCLSSQTCQAQSNFTHWDN